MIGFKHKNFTPGRTNYTKKQVERILKTLKRMEELENAKAKIQTIHANMVKKLRTLKQSPKKKY